MNVDEKGEKLYWVLAKNLSSNKFKCLKSSELYVLNLFKWEFCPFKPDNTLDFAAKKDYGRIENDNVVLHWILKMTRTEDEITMISRDIRAFNISNPKRKSVGPTIFPLTKFKLMNEKITALNQKVKATDTAQRGKKDREEKILSAYLKKAVSTPATAVVNVQQFDTDPNMNMNPPSVPNSTKDPLDVADQQCSDMEVAALREENVRLKTENAELLEKVDAAMKQYTAERDRRLEMEEKFTTQISELKTVKEDLMKFSGELKVGLTKDGVNAEGNACALHTSRKSEVPAGMVDIGSGVFRSQKDIEAVATEYFKFSARVSALCDIFWPDAVHEMSLSGGNETKLITAANIKVMTAILNKMPWYEDDLPKEKSRAKKGKEADSKKEDSKKEDKKEDCEDEKEEEKKNTDKGPIKIHKAQVREQVRKVTFNARAKKTALKTDVKEKKPSKRKAPSAPHTQATKQPTSDDVKPIEENHDVNSSPKQQRLVSTDSVDEYEFVNEEKGSELDIQVSEHESE